MQLLKPKQQSLNCPVEYKKIEKTNYTRGKPKNNGRGNSGKISLPRSLEEIQWQQEYTGICERTAWKICVKIKLFKGGGRYVKEKMKTNLNFLST